MDWVAKGATSLITSTEITRTEGTTIVLTNKVSTKMDITRLPVKIILTSSLTILTAEDIKAIIILAMATEITGTEMDSTSIIILAEATMDIRNPIITIKAKETELSLKSRNMGKDISMVVTRLGMI